MTNEPWHLLGQVKIERGMLRFVNADGNGISVPCKNQEVAVHGRQDEDGTVTEIKIILQ